MPDTYVICVSLLLYIHNKSPCKTGGEMWVRELVKKNTNCGQEGVPFLFSLSIGGNQQRRVCKRLNCILVIWLRSSKQVDFALGEEQAVQEKTQFNSTNPYTSSYISKGFHPVSS